MALQLTELPSKGIFARVFNILTRPKATLRETEALGARFALLDAPARDGSPDWVEVESYVGRFADRMLLPDHLAPPPQSLVRQVSWPGLEKRMLLETACEIVKRTRMPMYRRLLGLIDPDGAHTDMLYDLLKHFTAVHVVTENLDAYETAAEAMMEQLGAPVLVGTSLSMLSDCVLVVAPGAAWGEEAGRLPCPVLAGSGFRPSQACDLIGDLRLAVPPELAARCPKGVSPHRFAAALCAYSGWEPEGYVADTLLLNYRECRLSDAVLAVM